MEEMTKLQEIAKALFEAQTPVSGKLNPIIFGRAMTWDEVAASSDPEIKQHDCMSLAMIAVETMRKPNDAMLKAGAQRWHPDELYLGDAGLVWDRAIDAALGDRP